MKSIALRVWPLNEVRFLTKYSRTGSRLSVTHVGGVCPNRAVRWRGPRLQCRSCADFKVAVTIARLTEVERTWVMMQDEPPQAGNRARKSFRRHQWSDHAGELGLGPPRRSLVWDGHAHKPFSSWEMARMEVRVLQDGIRPILCVAVLFESVCFT